MYKYVGVPYKHKGRDMGGLDCWGLIILIYREKFGVELPDLEEYDQDWAKQGEDYFRKRYKEQEKLFYQFQKVDKPEEYDLILFYSSKHRFANHGGVYLKENKFIHCPQTGVVVSRLYDALWRDRVQGFYRVER